MAYIEHSKISKITTTELILKGSKASRKQIVQKFLEWFRLEFPISVIRDQSRA